MTDFVRDACSGGSVIRGRVPLTVEIWWLKDAGRESLGIGAEHDDCAGRLRIERPVDGIDGLFQLGQVARTIESFRAPHVSESIAARDFERGVVDPRVGIADEYLEGRQFGERLLFCWPRHPSEIRNASAESSD